MCLVLCEGNYVGVVGSVVVERCESTPLIEGWCSHYFSVVLNARGLTVICDMKIVKTNIRVED